MMPKRDDNENLSFHFMSEDDVIHVYELEKECFSVPWSIKSISEELQNANARFILAEINGETAGYVGSYFVSGEVYITNVAVKNKYRRKGVAVGLLSELIDLAKDAESEFVSLEVRCSNAPAISLYGKLGFEKIGVRENFYENPREDALIMTKYL
ncbi:MAG: ribosomal protein S18-alanine N-acetyltransferase [Ruminococcus sp.]|nr:ribosomal protein S18-alanine N-acetyltransferase [Ruminococcus sp.]MDY3895112.1 ribosomal protein S18-alanine N-acetyltransferase [Candidatus Fimenecus sp.]